MTAPERPRCPDCHLPHDLEPDSIPARFCAEMLRRIAAEDFEVWEREVVDG
jgi:hypothetical protein